MVGTGASRSTEGARHIRARSPSTGGGRDPDRPAPGPLPTLARPDLRRDRRPGSGRRDAPQRRPHRTGSATRSCSSGRAARARPRWPGSWPRPSTARTCRTATRATPARRASSIREGTTLDLIEIDAASNRGIDDVRDLRERLPYPPGQLRRKVYILDEAHQITKDAWNALLKSLEEPPDFVIFMFASTEPSGFPPAILSRLQRFDVRRLTVAEIEGKLAPHPRRPTAGRPTPAAIRLIARLAAGGMRDAESMLDQLLVGRRPTDRRGARPRPARPGRRRGGRRVRRRLVARRRRRRVACSTSSTSAAATSRASSTRSSTRSGSDLVAGLARSATDARHDPPRWRGRSPARRDRPEPRRRSAGSASSSSSRCSVRRAGGAGAAAARRPRHAPRPATTRPAARRTAAADAARRRAAAVADPRPRHDRRAGAGSAIPEPAAAPGRRAGRPRAASARSRQTARRPTRRRTARDLASDRPTATPATDRRSPPADAEARPRRPALDELLAAWPAIVAQLSAHPPTKPLIIACRPVAVDGADRHPRLPGGAGVPQGRRRAPPAGDRGGHRRGPRPAGHRPLRRRPTSRSSPAAPLGDAAYVLAEARRIFADDLVDVGEVS